MRPSDVYSQSDHTPWAWLLQLLLGCFVLTSLAACAKELPRSTDPNGKVSFVAPDGWQEVPGSSGTGFRPPHGEVQGVRMQVNTLLRESDLERLEKQRDFWLMNQEKNGERVLFSRAWQLGDLEGLEYAHTAVGSMGAVIWHHVIATNGEIVLATNLMTPTDQYDRYRKVFSETLDSIRLR